MMTVSRAKPRLPTIVREGIWVGGGQVATALATLGGLKILTTLLSPGAYGELALLLGLAALCNAFFCGPLLQAVMRFYPDAAKDGAIASLRRLAARYLIRSTAAAAAVLVIGGALWAVGSGAPSSFPAFALLAVYFAADIARTFETNLLNAARRQAACALRTVADAWARPALAVAAILTLGPSPLSVLIGYAAGSLAITLAFSHYRVQSGELVGPGVDGAWGERTRASFLAYALPLAPMAVLNWIPNLSDRYILAGISGTAAAGLYAAAYGLGSQPFLMANGFLLSTLRPVLYDAVARGDRAKERRVLWAWLSAVVAVSGAGVALYVLLARWLVGLLLGPEYQGAATLLPWIAGAYALQNVQQTFEITIYAHGRTRRLVVVQALAAASAIVLYAVLIPRFGAQGAAAGTLGVFVVTCLASFLLAEAYGRFGRR